MDRVSTIFTTSIAISFVKIVLGVRINVSGLVDILKMFQCVTSALHQAGVGQKVTLVKRYRAPVQQDFTPKTIFTKEMAIESMKRIWASISFRELEVPSTRYAPVTWIHNQDDIGDMPDLLSESALW